MRPRKLGAPDSRAGARQPCARLLTHALKMFWLDCWDNRLLPQVQFGLLLVSWVRRVNCGDMNGSY